MSAHFHPLRVLEVRQETGDAVTVSLEPAFEERELFRYAAGQHLTLRTVLGGEDVRRNYSLYAPPGHGPLRIAIKRTPGGLFSSWAAERLRAGDVIESMPPAGHFTWPFSPNARRNYLAFAGGSGITPILSLLTSGLQTEPRSQFTLLFGNRTSNAVMFLDEISTLKDGYLSRLQVYHFLSAEADDIDLFNGRLDQERVAHLLKTLIDPKQVDAAFICGPGPMMDTAERAMVEAGVDPACVLVERFTTGPLSEAQLAAQRAVSQQAQGLQMQVTLDGRRRTVAFDSSAGNILDSVRAGGMPAPYACKAGVCATCRAKLTSGDVHMLANYGLSKEEVAQGYILTCQAAPLTADVAVDYDA